MPGGKPCPLGCPCGNHRKKRCELGCTCYHHKGRILGVPCSATCGCDRIAKAKGLCRGHWEQQHTGKPFTPIRPPRSRCPPNCVCGRHHGRAMGNKPETSNESYKRRQDERKNKGICQVCNKNATEPNKPRCAGCLETNKRRTQRMRTKRQTAGVCVDCGTRRASTKSDRLCTTCKEKQHRSRRLGIFKITSEDYAKMLKAQGNVCAVCKLPETKLRNNGEVASLAVDHDHSCCPERTSCGKCVRGLLCRRCNFAMGHFNDNPATLRAAAGYLEKHAAVLSNL